MVSDDDGKLPTKWKKVCVVGAGMAGLAAARQLRREGHAVTVLEQASDVGGQWLYDPRTDDDDPLSASPAPVRVHSSMYASLRLISPRKAKGFTDFPFPPVDGGDRDPRRFPGHRKVLLYLKDFCDAFGLMDAVRLNTRVLRVAMAPPQCGAPAVAGAGGERKWVVRSVRRRRARRHGCSRRGVRCRRGCHRTLLAAQPAKYQRNGGVEAAAVAQPLVPASGVRDEVVVMVGCGDSGKDIALDLIGVSKEVHLTTKSTEEAMTPAMSKLLAKYANLHLRPQIEHL